jgi:hypothetical protein
MFMSQHNKAPKARLTTVAEAPTSSDRYPRLRGRSDLVRADMGRPFVGIPANRFAEDMRASELAG